MQYLCVVPPQMWADVHPLRGCPFGEVDPGMDAGEETCPFLCSDYCKSFK
jgi:hypothetical protein